MRDNFTRIRKDLITSSLSDKDFRVLTLLISMSRCGECFPSIRTIATNLNKSKESVRLALNELEKQNLIYRENRVIGTGKKTSNIYKINEELLYRNLYKKSKSEAQLEFDNDILDLDWFSEED